MKIHPAARLQGSLQIPGDKSISHRSVMFGAIAQGTTEVTHFLQGADCLSTISCFRKLGIEIENTSDRVLVHGKGLRGLTAPSEILDCGNSGTTTRLISGILAGQPFDTVLTGDESIRRRPMKRIMEPLSAMGAKILSQRDNGCAPLLIRGSSLRGIHYHSKVASAQVKSAILLAGLYADSPTAVTEPSLSRNHTELMLKGFGAQAASCGSTAFIAPAKELHACKIEVPGDISSAAYFIAAGLLAPGSGISIRNVGVNPTRDGLIRACQAMGGKIRLENLRETGGEPAADLFVEQSALHGITLEGDIIPAMIDELPVAALLACFAEGETVIRDAAELKVKESNRIAIMTENLRAMGADVTETEDGMIIRGGRPLHHAEIDSQMDHRIAMTFAVAGLFAEGGVEIRGAECVGISYPGFFEDLEGLRR